MSDAIFISYRRDDSEGEAGRLYDDLIRVFGADAVFMDVSDIHPGKDFRRAIDENVSRCAVLLAIIGPGWTSVKDAAGGRRLDQPNDFVRLEIASALARDIDVIPVLVHGAPMPAPADLPESLQDLAYRNCVELTHTRWNSDVEAFSRTLRQYVHRADTFHTRAIHHAITGEAAAEAATSPVPVEPPKPKTSLNLLRLVAAGLVLVAAGLAGASAYVYIHHKLKHHDTDEGKASEQAQDQGQTPNSGSPPASSPSDQAATPATPAPQAVQTDASAAIPASRSVGAPTTQSTASPVSNPLAGTWVATAWHTNARSSIPIGTPVEFEIAQIGDQFSVDMFATVGNALAWCGQQSVALTNQGLSTTWDEAASRSCGKYPGVHTVNLRLYMIDTRMHMIMSGNGMSTGMDFDRIQ